MGFTTQIFLFVFLPVSVGGYFICGWLETRGPLAAFFRRHRVRDLALTVLSMGFYGWACFDGIFQLAVYILAVRAAGQLILAVRPYRVLLPVVRTYGDERRICGVRAQVLVMAAASCAVLLCLFRYKYLDFAAEIWNRLFQKGVSGSSLLAPLGISFITFSAISYLADIYQEKAPAGSLLDCALYLSFFPKVVSGPIVLWRDFQPQGMGRRASLDRIVDGLNRIMTGFAKKLILADMFGACIEEIDAAAGVDALSAWGAVLLYMLQIYYDFAGYSDIAIGLAKLFGFEFRENFDFPYRARSITEFWRRWHISLGAWFREYVYIPLGGNRRGRGRTLWNLAVVFALTGVWHGAGWNYILWGAMNGAFVLLERVVRDRPLYRKTPGLLKWAGASFITMMCWELFRFQSLTELAAWLRIMLGLVRPDTLLFTWRYYFDFRMVFLVAVGILGATVLGGERVRRAYGRFAAAKAGFAVQEVGLLLLFVLSILCMVNSTYSPFIYFQY